MSVHDVSVHKVLIASPLQFPSIVGRNPDGCGFPDPFVVELVSPGKETNDPSDVAGQGLDAQIHIYAKCYTQAAERFGRSKQSATPGTKTEGNYVIGYGMARATYPANRSAAQAVVRLLPGGRLFVKSGPGT